MNEQDFEIDSRLSEAMELLRDGELDLAQGGARLFSYGYQLDRQGKQYEAERVYGETIELLEDLCSKRSSIEELNALAGIAFDHGANLYKLGRYPQARVSFHRSVEILGVIREFGASSALIEKLARTLYWQGRAQRQLGEHQDARQSFLQSLGHWRSLLVLFPGDSRSARYRQGLLAAIIGCARCGEG